MTTKQEAIFKFNTILAKQRKKLARDKQIIAAMCNNPSPSDMVSHSVRSSNRFVELVACVSEVAEYIDNVLPGLNDDLSKATQEQYDFMRQRLHIQERELRDLRRTAESRKALLDQDAEVIKQLRERVESLEKTPTYEKKTIIECTKRITTEHKITECKNAFGLQIHIAKHAIDRFRERTGCTQDDTYIADKLHEMFNRSTEVELMKKYAVLTIIKHHCRTARYFTSDGWILVVEWYKNRNVLRTIHNGQAKRWQAKKD